MSEGAENVAQHFKRTKLSVDSWWKALTEQMPSLTPLDDAIKLQKSGDQKETFTLITTLHLVRTASQPTRPAGTRTIIYVHAEADETPALVDLYAVREF